MSDKNNRAIFPAKNTGKNIIKIAEQNAAKTTAEIQKKIKEMQQSGKKMSSVKKKGGRNTVNSNRLKLLITIVPRNKAEFYVDLIQSFEVNMQCVTVAQGTANENMLGLLGLSSDKVVICSVIQESKVPEAMRTLESKFNSIKGGKGVAWTIPLTSVIGTLIYGFLSNNRETVKEKQQ